MAESNDNNGVRSSGNIPSQEVPSQEGTARPQEHLRRVSAIASAGSGASFEPEITAFTCIYCGAMAGDSAGFARLTYPANVKIIRLPCTGKVDTEYILKAFEQGADGVYVIACPIGNCHHERGNVRATKRVEYVRKLLDDIGLGRERLGIYYASGGQGHAFANAAREMTTRVRRIGPNPIKRSNGHKHEA